VTIVRLAPAHLAGVAALHARYLSTRFPGRPGQALLRAWYASVATTDAAVAYVADGAGRPTLGYVCGVWALGRLRREFMRRHWHTLVLWGSLQLVRRPAMLMAPRPTPAPEPVAATADEYELRAIVVEPAIRGAGVAAALVEAIVADAGTRGFRRLHLFVETDNRRARAFYEKVGFDAVATTSRGARAFVRYERPVAA
jgi:ribosomal protein S18 acetylase RimI-like enzyme